ncbi:cytidine deaminase [Bacillus piscicola]|uniref:cytidine deaminase n=1 Tax=Bacillus piscicola TaxID=1632684 RepID=UPI001F09CF24|nr:cytidine deaminase [Bacillus piscicola]
MVADQALLQEALAAREMAYVPYSRFAVGAAVLTDKDHVHKGCNIENASYGLTNCAERTALFKAVSEGGTKIKAIAVAADTAGPTAPCGACRQVLAEFLPADGKIILGNVKGDIHVTTMIELLPGAFTAEDMK